MLGSLELMDEVTEQVEQIQDNVGAKGIYMHCTVEMCRLVPFLYKATAVSSDPAAEAYLACQIDRQSLSRQIILPSESTPECTQSQCH